MADANGTAVEITDPAGDKIDVVAAAGKQPEQSVIVARGQAGYGPDPAPARVDDGDSAILVGSLRRQVTGYFDQAASSAAGLHMQIAVATVPDMGISHVDAGIGGVATRRHTGSSHIDVNGPAIADAKPRRVVHLQSVSGVRYVYSDIAVLIDNNTLCPAGSADDPVGWVASVITRMRRTSICPNLAMRAAWSWDVLCSTTLIQPQTIGCKSTRNSGTYTTQYVTFPSGNVGVGNTPPGYNLDVTGVIHASNSVFAQNISIAGTQLFSPFWPYETISNNSNLRLATSGGVYFHTGSNNTSSSSSTYIDGSGNASFNGNIYWGTGGNWLSAYLNQAVLTSYSPTFSNVTIPGGGGGGGGIFAGNGDNATTTTVDVAIKSWWGIGFTTSCCGNSVNYPVVINSRAGNITAYGTVTDSGENVNGTLNISGSSPLYFSSYGGGWYMSDSTSIRSHRRQVHV